MDPLAGFVRGEEALDEGAAVGGEAVVRQRLFLLGARLGGGGLAQRGLGGGEAGDADAVRRARDVVQAELVTELDGGGVAAVPRRRCRP